MFKFKEIDEKPADIWRVFIAGPSSAGKTYFARELLAAQYFKCKRVYFYHPDIQEEFPVSWHKTLCTPVIYQAGLPTKNELCDIPHYSCIVIDDLFTEACSDGTISYLFRVLSSKKKLHVIIMTQRYFAEGSHGLNIRNSSNYHVLMSNTDVRPNMQIARAMNLKKEFLKAMDRNSDKLYPYIFLDRTNHARVLGIQIYIDIFSPCKQVIYNSMPSYLVSEADFKAYFKILDKNVAIQDVNPAKIKNTKGFGNPDSDTNRVSENQKTTNPKETPTQNPTGTATNVFSGYDSYRKRKDLERQVRHIVQRYKIRSKL